MTEAPAKTEAAKAPPPAPPPWYATLREDPPSWLGKVLGAACLLLVLLVWYVLTVGNPPAVPELLLPSPGKTFGATGELVDRGLVDGIIATLMRVIIGFGAATIVGVGTGVLAASFRGLNAFLTPIVLFGRSLPLAALLPLTVVWFGIEESQKQMFIYIAAVPFVFSDTVKAISLVPQRYVETAETLGASRAQIILKVLFPLALPEIVTGLRFLFGLSLGYIMLAEVINANAGLGFLINQGDRLSKTDHTFLLLIVIGILAYLIDWTIRFFQRHAFPYRKDL